MRLTFLGILILVIVAPVHAQENPKVAVRANISEGKDGIRLYASLANLTDAQIKLRDGTLPPFAIETWFSIQTDGKPAPLRPRPPLAVTTMTKPKEITIAQKNAHVFGGILLLANGAKPEKIDPSAPILYLAPGEHTIRLALRSERAQGNRLTVGEPATIKVTIQPADAKPVTPTYKRVGDLAIKADVYRLPGDDVRPAIVWIHGGALITGQRSGIRAEQRARYLDAGFVVVSIDYRLAPETKLKGIIEDVQDAFKWVRGDGAKQYKIDPKRIAVVGHSAGGYLTLMSGFAVEPRPQALVPFYGYGDIVGDWYAKPDPFYRKTRPIVSKEDAYKAISAKEIAEGNVNGRGDFYMYCRQNGLWPQLVVGHDLAKEPRAFDRFCPIRNVTKDYPPTLLLHGDNDTDVPYQQSVDMAAELRKHGVTHELITIKKGPHGFDGKGLKDAEVGAAFERVMAFLKKHVK